MILFFWKVGWAEEVNLKKQGFSYNFKDFGLSEFIFNLLSDILFYKSWSTFTLLPVSV